MKRWTLFQGKGKPYLIEAEGIRPEGEAWAGPAAEKLAAFENAYDALLAEEARIEGILSELRAQNQQKTVRFKQLLAQKLTQQNLRSLLEIHGVGGKN